MREGANSDTRLVGVLAGRQVPRGSEAVGPTYTPPLVQQPLNRKPGLWQSDRKKQEGLLGSAVPMNLVFGGHELPPDESCSLSNMSKKLLPSAFSTSFEMSPSQEKVLWPLASAIKAARNT